MVLASQRVLAVNTIARPLWKMLHQPAFRKCSAQRLHVLNMRAPGYALRYDIVER